MALTGEVLSIATESYRNGSTLAEIAAQTDVPVSTVRLSLLRAGITMRPAGYMSEAARMRRASTPSPLLGRTFSPEVRQKMRDAKRIWWDERGVAGVCKKPSGYLEYTTGEHKHRAVHRVLMEAIIGRPLTRDEVVHHIDHDRTNNDPSNLQLMTRSEHARLHANEYIHSRARGEDGRLK